MSSRRIRLREDVSKTSSRRRLTNTSWRHLENVLKDKNMLFWGHFQDLFKRSSTLLRHVFTKLNVCWVSWPRMLKNWLPLVVGDGLPGFSDSVVKNQCRVGVIHLFCKLQQLAMSSLTMMTLKNIFNITWRWYTTQFLYTDARSRRRIFVCFCFTHFLRW